MGRDPTLFHPHFLLSKEQTSLGKILALLPSLVGSKGKATSPESTDGLEAVTSSDMERISSRSWC